MLENTKDQKSKFLILKARNKDEHNKDIIPYFSVLSKSDDKYSEVAQCNRVIGILQNIKLGSFEWESKPVDKVEIFLVGQDSEGNRESYLIDLRFSNSSRGLINSLINLENLEDEVSINIYNNKNGYMSYGLFQKNEMVKWKHDFKDIPQPRKVLDPETNEVIKTDYSKTNQFFKDELTNFINSNFNKDNSSAENNSALEVESDVPDLDGDDDCPF